VRCNLSDSLVGSNDVVSAGEVNRQCNGTTLNGGHELLVGQDS
jgi:hypothetical protein